MILEDKLSYIEIGKIYNCSGSNIKKVAQRLGIELVSKRKINPSETFNRKAPSQCLYCGKDYRPYYRLQKYCSNECASAHKHTLNFLKFKEGNKEMQRANYNPKSFKKDILKEQGNKCAICGCSPIHNGKPLVFILDHIDGHASNNTIENLRCICPNCDSQLDTYKSKNKCGERSYYRYHKMESGQDG